MYNSAHQLKLAQTFILADDEDSNADGADMVDAYTQEKQALVISFSTHEDIDER